MSKKNKKLSQEIPQVGNALEVPNYVIPMTDLEYKQTVNETKRSPDSRERAEDCRCENCET